MKERVTLTIEEDVLKRVDSTVDGSTVKNRSHAVEMLISKALAGNSVTKAVILAAGKSEVLSNLTKEVPKPMLRINGKPILLENIELLKKYGMRDIILVVGYKGEEIKNYFGDGSELGVNITYVETPELRGTAGSLRLAKDKLDSTFIVCNGDELKDININEMLEFHRRNNSSCTIALTHMTDPSEYGVALLDGNNIMTFIERPPKKGIPSNMINAGLYIMEPEALEGLPRGFSQVTEYIFPRLASKDKLFGYPFAGQWFGLRSEQELKKAGVDWKGIQ